ncbi:Porphobilinogen deaminase [Candidatus Magnetaquicoccaceae bacterium FCR-1]|uniref:Porphobilinogen deaminase n=1 Tax=Candidatus Magnetaquiglobus chichijimensis TaxID=3141448 RepID=A0ABQ0CCY0_9PROT
MNTTLKIGTRGSALALWQARWVQSRLESTHPGLKAELVIIKTRGDIILDVPLAKVGGKGLFVKELEEALLDGRVDLAVHSMKDVPAEFPEGLGIAAILEREDPRDVLLSVRYAGLSDLPHGARVGSSSLRRQCQLLHERPDLRIESLRGNVNTRIAKLESGQFEAIVLAAAGVKRLGLLERVVEYFAPERIIPANGQGAVGIECRLNDAATRRWLEPLNHPETRTAVRAERAFLHELEGGCQVPIAGFARLEGERLVMAGRVGSLDGRELITRDVSGDPEEPEALGRALARALIVLGADRLLAAPMMGS